MNAHAACDFSSSLIKSTRSSKPVTNSGSQLSRVPMVDLGAAIRASRLYLENHLEELFASEQFILGEQCAVFERDFAKRMGAPHAVGVGSGTAALELCLRAADIIRPDQQVITSALTSPFTAQAIRNAGAKPVFADIDPDRLLIDPQDVTNRMTSSAAAIVPVHLYGQACDLVQLRRIARNAGLVIVQDACQAHGATFRGQPLAHFSPLIAYSFYPTKNLGCLGDGGAVVTRSVRLAAKVRMLRDGGRSSGQVSRMAGINSRLDEIQACFLRAFLRKLTQWNSSRARLAALYDEALAGCDAVQPVRRSPESANHLYVIRTSRRESLRAHLAEHRIASAVHYPVPLHLHPAFSDCGLKPGALPNAERACREVLSLPLWPYLSESSVLRVAECIRRFFTFRFHSNLRK